MKGSTYKRCACPVELDTRGRRKACKKAHGSWFYAADLGTVTRVIKVSGPALEGAPWPVEYDKVSRRQVKRGGFTTKTEADAVLAELLASVATGQAVHDERQTVGAFLDKWIEGQVEANELGQGGVRPTTATSYQQHIRDHIKPHLGHLRLRDLRPGHVQDMVRALARPDENGKRRSPATVQRINATLRSALTTAVRQQLVAYNAASLIDLPSVPAPKVHPWEPEEAGAFLDRAASDELGALFEVAALTGLRRGELCGLRWVDVDLEGAFLVVRQQVTRVGSQQYVGKPKTASGEDRVVALAPELVGALIAHQLHQATVRDVAGSAWVDTGLVFTQADGTGWNPNTVSQRFQQLSAAAGLRRVRFHDLRHGTASMALASGVDMAVVSKMLGHSTVSFTNDRYAHLLQGVGAAAAAAVENIVPRARRDQSVPNPADSTPAATGPDPIVAGQDRSTGGAGGARTHDLTDYESGHPHAG